MNETGEKIDDDRESYYFHFSLTQLCQDFTDIAKFYIKSSLNTLKDIILNDYGFDEASVEEPFQRLTQLFENRASEPLLRFEETVQEIFALPSNVLLPGYSAAAVISDKDIEDLEAEVDQLHNQYLEELHYHIELLKGAQNLERVKGFYENGENVLKMFKNRTASGTKSFKELLEVVKDCYKHNLRNQNTLKSRVMFQ